MNKIFVYAMGFLFIASVMGAGIGYAEDDRYSVDILINQHDVSTCPAGGGQMLFATMKNTGTNTDSYRLTADRDWVVMPEVTLAPGEEQRVGILIAIGDPEVLPGTYNLELEFHSARSKNVFKDNIIVKTLDCPGVVLEPASKAFSGCMGEIITARLIMKNLGNVADSFIVESTGGALSNESIVLESGEVKEVYLYVTPAEGDEEITVSVKSAVSYARASTSMVFNGRDCYSFELSLEPEYVRACVEDGADFAVRITNTGERKDVYSIRSNIGSTSEQDVEVLAGNSRILVLNVMPGETGIHEVLAEVVSEHDGTSLLAEAEIGLETCYGFDVEIVPEMLLSENYSGILSSVVINNTGIRKDNYSIRIEGPFWMDLLPEELTIDTNTTKKSYVYVSPVYGIENKTYTADVFVTSVKTDMVVERKFDFVFGMQESNETAGDPSSIDGDVPAKSVSKRTIYALIIGLSLVLIIFFGREFRKMSKEAEKEEQEEKEKKTPKKRGRKKKVKDEDKKDKEKSDDIKDILDGI